MNKADVYKYLVNPVKEGDEDKPLEMPIDISEPASNKLTLRKEPNSIMTEKSEILVEDTYQIYQKQVDVEVLKRPGPILGIKSSKDLIIPE